MHGVALIADDIAVGGQGAAEGLRGIQFFAVLIEDYDAELGGEDYFAGVGNEGLAEEADEGGFAGAVGA